MPDRENKPANRKADAIAALLTEPTLAAAAAKAGVSERTLRNWLRQPQFLAAYRQARRQVVEGAVARLQQLAGEAVETLKRNLAALKNGDQIKAAVAVLDRALRGTELLDLAEQVEDLKRQLEEVLNASGYAATGSGQAQGEVRDAVGAEPTPGEDPAGPSPNLDCCGDDSRPVAEQIVAIPYPTETDAM